MLFGGPVTGWLRSGPRRDAILGGPTTSRCAWWAPPPAQPAESGERGTEQGQRGGLGRRRRTATTAADDHVKRSRAEQLGEVETATGPHIGRHTRARDAVQAEKAEIARVDREGRDVEGFAGGEFEPSQRIEREAAAPGGRTGHVQHAVLTGQGAADLDVQDAGRALLEVAVDDVAVRQLQHAGVDHCAAAVVDLDVLVQVRVAAGEVKVAAGDVDRAVGQRAESRAGAADDRQALARALTTPVDRATVADRAEAAARAVDREPGADDRAAVVHRPNRAVVEDAGRAAADHAGVRQGTDRGEVSEAGVASGDCSAR